MESVWRIQIVHYCVMLIRMVVSMTYYGLSLNTGNLGGDFYVNFLISGVVEFPAYTLCLLLLDRWGRKKCHCSAMLLGGIACLCTIFTISFGGNGNWFLSLHQLSWNSLLSSATKSNIHQNKKCDNFYGYRTTYQRIIKTMYVSLNPLQFMHTNNYNKITIFIL